MSKVLGIVALVGFVACSLATLTLSAAVRESAPAVVDAAPAMIQELRRTDTLDELQQFEKLERPSRPVWPFVLALVVSVGLTVIVAGTPFLKQANSTLRLFKRKGGGGGSPHQAPPPLPIILPPGYGQQQQLPSGERGDQEW